VYNYVCLCTVLTVKVIVFDSCLFAENADMKAVVDIMTSEKILTS